jgi:hypothetical protein
LQDFRDDTAAFADSNDEDDGLNDSLDDAAWEAEVAGRHAFLTGLGGGAGAAGIGMLGGAMAALHAAAASPSPSPSPPLSQMQQQQQQRHNEPRELGGLDDDVDEADWTLPSSQFSAAAGGSFHPAVKAQPHPAVPSLFEMAIEQLGLQFAAIGAQDVAQRLPPGTLRAAILAVRKAEALNDSHMPLLFRTLASGGNNKNSNIVSSRSWLEEDCGLDALVSSSLDSAEDAAAEIMGEAAPSLDGSAAASPSPSPSPSPPSAAVTASSASKPRSATAARKPVTTAAGSALSAVANLRFAPLKGTPGVSAGSHSMNTATLARAAKAQKLAAQIAAQNVQPHAKPNVQAQTAQVKSQAQRPARSATSSSSSTSFPRTPNQSASAIPSDYIIAEGEWLDLRGQHRLTEQGFRTLAQLMEYTTSRARNPEAFVSQSSLASNAPTAAQAEDTFTEEQRARLAAAGVSADLRALLRSVNPTSAFASSSVVAAAALPSSLADMVARLGIWRPVSLVHLDVSFTSISSSSLALVARQCPSLLKLNICGCERLTNTGLADVARLCKQLQVLLMEVLPCLDDRAVQDVVHGLPRLLALDVGSCRKISNVSFQIIGTHGKNLKRLSAAGCTHLNDFDVEDISRCVSLLSLSLRACGKITDASIEALVLLSKRKKKAHMRGLERIDLGGCARISDGGLYALVVAYASSLRHLDLRGLARLTDRSLDAILARCRGTLTYLNIAECNAITEAKVNSIRQAWPELEIIR